MLRFCQTIKNSIKNYYGCLENSKKKCVKLLEKSGGNEETRSRV
jgi:hypothetical protein